MGVRGKLKLTNYKWLTGNVFLGGILVQLLGDICVVGLEAYVLRYKIT